MYTYIWAAYEIYALYNRNILTTKIGILTYKEFGWQTNTEIDKQVGKEEYNSTKPYLCK
jgi:hypothetical protein